MKRSRIEPGDYLVQCDVTGFRVLASETRKQWDGAIVWERVYDTRHPQDFLRGVRDNGALPFSRPKTDPVFLNVGDVKASDL